MNQSVVFSAAHRSNTRLMTLPQEGIPVHKSMIEYFTRFRDDILQHAKPTCFEELTVFHLLSWVKRDTRMGSGLLVEARMAASEKGYENGLGAMSAEERMAAYEKGIGEMSAEEKMAASEKGYKNGLGAMSAEERMAVSAKSMLAAGIAWEKKYAEFK